MSVIDRQRAVESCYLIPGWCWPVELGAIYDLCRGRGLHIELGSFCGRSLFVAACALAPGGQIIAVDPLTFATGTQYPLPSPGWPLAVLQATLQAIREVRPDVKVEHRRQATPDALRTLPRADSVNIDAEHHYAEVLAEIEACDRLVNPGGVLFGHDYWAVCPGVMDAVNEYFGERQRPFAVLPSTRIWVSRF